jgi:hypothetical protein
MTGSQMQTLDQQTEELLIELNTRFAVVTTNNGVSILHTRPSEAAGLSLLNKSDFNTLLCNRFVPGSSSQNAANWWLKHPRRRQYDRIVFQPGVEDQNSYNLWRGFAIQPAEGDCALFWVLLREVICSGNQILYDYIKCWLAHLFQHPGELPGTSIVLRGKQGTGKTTFADTIGKLVGEPHYLSVTCMSQVTGRFNAHLANTLLLTANEAIWGGNKAEEGNLKAMVTDRTVAIEGKGRDVIQLPNYKRLIACTNNQWAVPMDADDRRFLVLDVSDVHKEDQDYFSALFGQLNGGGYEALMYDLMTANLDSFNPRLLPRTGTGLDIKLRSGDAALRWIYELLELGANDQQPATYFERANSKTERWMSAVAKSNLYDSYSTFCSRQRERHIATDSEFFKFLRRVLPRLDDNRSSIKGGRIRQLVFPALSECRTQFENYMNMSGKIEWGAED